MSLTTIANECRTDKGTTTGNCHAYTCVYDMLFTLSRSKPINIMEVGLSVGGPEFGNDPDRRVTDAPSLCMWRRYFPHAHIYGVDISDFSAFETDYFSFFRADCGDAARLDQIANTAPECDVIVDDGSHASYHQQLTFCKLFPLLKSGGLYIMEDLDWQPAAYEQKLPQTPKTAHLLSTFIQTGKFPSTGGVSDTDWRAAASHIEGVLLFTEGYLSNLRHLFNMRAKLHYVDSPPFASRRHAEQILASARTFIRSFAGRAENPMYSRIKLAVIQKTLAPNGKA